MTARRFLQEYEAFQELEHWRPVKNIISLDKLMDLHEPLFPLLNHLYRKVQDFYRHLPRRRNGDTAFLHPINVVWNLKKAGISEGITLCAAILHDYVEEQVDAFKRKNKLGRDAESIKRLDRHEAKVFMELEREMVAVCAEHGLAAAAAYAINDILKLLTRHKRHFYYQSISCIFNAASSATKECAIQIKLADRLHNILCIECFNEEERVYQCFKNLFILNNTKQYLRKKKYHHRHRRGTSATEKLFKKCGKATYDSFLAICNLSARKGFTPMIHSILQLAFRKFAIEHSGLKEVTEIDEREVHPMRLYHAVVRKYDARLHHEWDKFEQMKKSEMDYCNKFFANYHFNAEQLQALVDYKDAYALKEVVALLLYDKKYVIRRFLSSELSRQGRIKK